MLSFVDPASGTHRAIVRPRGGTLRLAVVAPSHAGRPTPTALRAALLADVLRRFQEHLHGVQVFVVFVVASGDSARLRRDLDALWIPPPTAVAASIEAASELLGGPLHLVIGTEQAPPGPPRLMVGPVNRSAGLVDGTDSLAVRLALLAVPYAVPTALDDDELDRSAARLERWRRAIVDWAYHTSAPIANAIVASVGRAFSDDLAVSRALDELDRLAGSEFVPAGTKFETFLHLDRIFALDLPRYLAGLSLSTSPTCAPRRS